MSHHGDAPLLYNQTGVHIYNFTHSFIRRNPGPATFNCRRPRMASNPLPVTCDCLGREPFIQHNRRTVHGSHAAIGQKKYCLGHLGGR